MIVFQVVDYNHHRLKLRSGMENFLRQNGLAIVVYIALLAAAYGDLTAKLATVKQVQDEAQKLVPDFIEMKSEVRHMSEEVARTRTVWFRLDETLDKLNTTMVRQEVTLNAQGESIDGLKKDMEIIKKAVVK